MGLARAFSSRTPASLQPMPTLPVAIPIFLPSCLTARNYLPRLSTSTPNSISLWSKSRRHRRILLFHTYHSPPHHLFSRANPFWSSEIQVTVWPLAPRGASSVPWANFSPRALALGFKPRRRLVQAIPVVHF